MVFICGGLLKPFRIRKRRKHSVSLFNISERKKSTLSKMTTMND